MSNHSLPTDYQTFISTSRYSKWIDELKRREVWPETVERYIDNVVKPKLDDTAVIDRIRTAILNLDVMPSMRAMMTAGPALERDNTCAYNCSYLPVDDLRSFDEAMFILLCGTGVGFSVERQYVNNLPVIPVEMFKTDKTIVVQDSKEGWATSLRELVDCLWKGYIPKWDVSLVRPAGAKLKTFGGRASGPAPLVELFRFVISKVVNAKGRRLSSVECHDIMCKIGEVVVVGGVRRSAMISLSNLSDDRMRHAKSGQWWENDPQRALANNSISYTEKPDAETFLREWVALIESKSGERGIFNRVASQKQAAKNGRRDASYDFGTNPCSEIILRPYQFCNLTEVVIRSDDNMNTLQEKVQIATILGTVQASYTYFPYLRDIWRKNTEEEALLGVSMTGIMDHTFLSGKDCLHALSDLRKHCIQVNKVWAAKLDINQSAAITCVKPSGTVSQLVDSASGIHPRFSDYYIRTVRADNKDPLTEFMKAQGIPSEPCVMKPEQTTVFSFPIASPKGSTTTSQVTAIQQLELWNIYQTYWCEHKPSITVYVGSEEWLEVGAWVYKNFDDISGVSFLPRSDHSYQQAPYQEVDFDEYTALLNKMPDHIDWMKLAEFETEDTTASSQTFACSGDVCEIVDLT
jgi:ribonucleoside-triphosphate reductase